MYILGVSGFFHDSAAALIKDGRVICAVAEERLSRNKQDGSFPHLAIQACLAEAEITLDQVAHVGIGWQPWLRWSRGLLPFLRHLPKSYKLLTTRSASVNLKIRKFPDEFRARYGDQVAQAKFHFLPHHLCHAASSYYHSGFEEAAVLIIDAAGEADAAWLGVGRGNRLSDFQRISAFHSLGMVYSTVTEFLGFEPDGDEWKVMGMAPYGRPTLVKQFEDLIQLTSDGFKVDLSYFEYPTGRHPFFGSKFVARFGPPRPPVSEITPHYEDVAFGVQHLCERVMFHLAEICFKKTGLRNLCVAGGVALNGVSNGKILMKGPFEKFFGQPAAGDDGTALGAASLVWHQVLDQPLKARETVLENAYLGPSIREDVIERSIRESGLPFVKSASITSDVAALVAQGKIIGWYQGRSEFGPRALGNRSIIADPRDETMKDKINAKVKFREGFRPFAPAILESRIGDFFECTHPSPFMNLVYPIKPAKRAVIPAVTHVDGTGRLQSVSPQSNPRFYELISKFEALTGVPVILNTSFNVKGEPIVNTPEDAIKCFFASGIDCLVLGDYLLQSKE